MDDDVGRVQPVGGVPRANDVKIDIGRSCAASWKNVLSNSIEPIETQLMRPGR
ncbi:hypothetical protein RAA17_09490 [Komagataeibacter rhaeticus]|nr:hypothetical protein [Komagataeibacter rhaeticus]